MRKNVQWRDRVIGLYGRVDCKRESNEQATRQCLTTCETSSARAIRWQSRYSEVHSYESSSFAIFYLTPGPVPSSSSTTLPYDRSFAEGQITRTMRNATLPLHTRCRRDSACYISFISASAAIQLHTDIRVLGSFVSFLLAQLAPCSGRQFSWW